MCHESTIASQSLAEEHSCCKEESAGAHWCNVYDGTGIGKGQSCCGMATDRTPATVSSLDLFGGDGERVPLKAAFLSRIVSLPSSLHTIDLSQANRAPPYTGGLGSSKTYLFKRTLLI